MAAPRENLLSLGHLTSTDRDTFNTFTNRREHSLKKSFNRSMALQADFSPLQSHQHLRVTHLQQRWQELKDREHAAQQHNRQLLQQFEGAQDTLREMMTRTAAMKTIRIEYERYLEEISPRWQQQLKEKTQAAQRKRMEEYLKMCLENTKEEGVTKSSAERPLLSQGPTKKPQKVTAPQEYYSQNSHLDYNQDGASHLPYMQSSWLTHPHSQRARFPVRVPCQPQGSSQAPPSFLPHPHLFQLQHLAGIPAHHHPQPRQNPPGWASSQPDHSWSWASGAAGIPSGCEALWGQLYMEEPPPERGVVGVVAEEAETSRAPSSKTERGSGSRSSHSSQELDIKPVRLSSDHAESSESGRDSSQASREKKREKRGRARCTSSERERHSSKESSRTSSAFVNAPVSAAQTSENEASSEKGSTSSKKTRSRIRGPSAESPRMGKVAKERTRSKGDDRESHNEESQSTGEDLGSIIEESTNENAGNQSPVEKSESCRDESGSQREEGSGSVSIQLENGDAEEIEEQESSSSKQSSAGEKVVVGKGHEKDPGDGGEDYEGGKEKEPNSQRDEEQEDRDVEGDEISARKNTTEEEEETGAEDEMEEQESDEDQGDDEETDSDWLKNEDGEIRKQSSSQDEDERERSEDKIEDDDEGSDEEEVDGDGEEDEEQSDKTGEPEEERDSEDSIISPQENRPKKMHVIPEESAEDNNGSKTGSSDDDSNEIGDEDDIEYLLAPQTQTKEKKEKDLKTVEKPEVVCDNVEIFQVEPDASTKTDHQSDSDEFDHFYD